MVKDEIIRANDDVISVRDRFIYDVVTEKYKFEWQRFSQIESKATTTLGFLGVIFSLETTTGLYILKNVHDGYNYNFLEAVFFSFSLIFLFMSLIFALSSFWMREWAAVPNIKHFMSKYVNAAKNSTYMIKNLYIIYEDSIDCNYNNNEEKIKNLKYSLRFFAAGIVLLFLFLITHLITLL